MDAFLGVLFAVKEPPQSTTKLHGAEAMAASRRASKVLHGPCFSGFWPRMHKIFSLVPFCSSLQSPAAVWNQKEKMKTQTRVFNCGKRMFKEPSL